MRKLPAAIAAFAIVSLASCDARLTPHERYARHLARTKLDHTPLGKAWLAAADSTLREPRRVELPYRFAVALDHRAASAMAHRVALRHGQRLVVEVEHQDPDSLAIFVDLFEPSVDAATPRPITSAGADLRIDHEASGSSDVIVRIQPELLRSGRYTVALRAEPALAFPVAGRHDVGSGFGAPRDGGRRTHHGIDIFAPRGTPVVAAAGGRVASTESNALGGKVVWVFDPRRRQAHYYAHLDTQLVRTGQRVMAGDTLGRVGNTGNARTTAPHLHFGIYRSGPLDPEPFVLDPPRSR